MKKIVLSIVAAVVTPMILQAGGIGVYIPYSIGHTSTTTFHPADVGSATGAQEYSYDTTFKNKPGLGIALATNLGKDTIFGYKFGLEYTNPEGENWNDSDSKISVINTFEFAVLNTEMVKLWLGPRINIGYEWYDNNGYTQSGMEIGIAPAIGVNVNVTDFLAITFDIDYKFAAQAGTSNDAAYESYTSNPTGMTARLGVMYRFGEDDEY